MAIKFLSNQTIDSTLITTGAITSGGNLRVSSGVLYVGNGTNTTARIMGFGDYEMITGVSGATYLRVSGSSTLAGTLQSGQYILAAGLAYGAVNNFTQIIDGSTGAITGTSATFAGDVTLSKTGSTGLIIRTTDNTEPYFALQRNSGTNGVGVIRLLDGGDLTFDTGATGAGQTTRLTIDGSNGIATFTATTKSTRFTSTTSTALHWSNYTGTNGWQIGADSTAAGMYIYNENGVYCLKLTDAGNATFAGSVTATQFNGSVVITGGTASFVGTVAGATVVSSEGAYAANGNVKLYEAKRSGGAVGGDWSYNDATTNMSIGTSTSHSFAIKTADTPRLTIDSSGNSTFSGSITGTTATFSGSGTILSLNRNAPGTALIELKIANTIEGYLGATTTKSFVVYNEAGSEKAHVENNGNIGLYGSAINFLIGDFAEINFRESGAITIDSDNNQSSRNFQFKDGSGSSLMLIEDTGKVGIGTTAPATPLTVAGNFLVRTTTVDSYENRFQVVVGGAADAANVYIYDGGAAVKVRLNAAGDSYFTGGNVGIGTTSLSEKLHVSGGNVRIDSVNNANHLIIQNNATATSGTFEERIKFLGWNNNDNAAIIGIGNAYFGSPVNALAFQVSAVEAMRIIHGGNVGIGVTQPSYNLEIGGSSNPKIAIVSNINSATSSLYFGDSDSKDRGQIQYTHFGDFMEIKTGGGTRLYLESGINTAYTPDGLFNANATPSYWNHGQAQFKLGYMDNGSGLYSGAYCFNVKSTDGIPVTGREIGAVYIRDTSNNRMPLIISNQGRININQTNTSYGFGSSTGWLTIANGTSSYNFFNAYTGTDGTSGCSRYRLNNTSPSFFDFYYQTTQVGYITTNGTDIFYANTSDYRLKEDLKSFDGMSLLKQIQVYDFKWKESDNRMYGVVAHELQEVVPQAVVGEKDKEKLQAVDYSKLVPVLIKSIQELEARIKELENN